MGAYVYPTAESVGDFLKSKSDPMVNPPPSFQEKPGYLPVCIFLDLEYTTAAIAYDEREFRDLKREGRRRLSAWHWVKIEDLLPVSNLAMYLRELQ